MTHAPVAILGTGVASLGASNVLREAGVRFVRFDKNSYVGGHTRSIHYPSGFTFDEGVHISFTQNDMVKDVFSENVSGEFEEKDFSIDNVWRGLRIPHPVQCHLHWLPSHVAVEIVRSFISQRLTAVRAGLAEHMDRSTDAEINNCHSYAAWLYAAYGKEFADTFPIPYGEKYHTVSMERLNTEWVGPRMYRPSLDDLLLGLSGRPINDAHYVQRYRYPKRGGFVAFLGAKENFHTLLDHEVVGLDPDAKLLRFAHGAVSSYSNLISTMPLPDLIAVIDNAPPAVVEASKRLSFTSAVLINIGIDRTDLSNTDMTYFYDRDIIVSRIHLPHRLSRNNAPEGCGSIQAEVYFSEKYQPLRVTHNELIGLVIRDLGRTGFINDDDKILMAEAVGCRYANVIYDHDRAQMLPTIRDYLNSKKIYCCGRYGDWDHAWTDQAFMSGDAAARRLIGG